MTNQLVERGYLTQSLGSASHSGEHGFKAVPGLLKRAIEERAWEKRLIVETGEEFEGFRSLEDYIRANPPKGLGASIGLIDDLIGKDEDLRATFYQALRRPRGGDNHNYNITDKVDNVKVVSNKLPSGNSKAYALQKLSDEGQVDLLNQVKAGKISANEAMKQAGYRRPRRAISLDDPESAAKTILTHASPEFVNELIRLLKEGNQEGAQP